MTLSLVDLDGVKQRFGLHGRSHQACDRKRAAGFGPEKSQTRLGSQGLIVKVLGRGASPSGRLVDPDREQQADQGAGQRQAQDAGGGHAQLGVAVVSNDPVAAIPKRGQGKEESRQGNIGITNGSGDGVDVEAFKPFSFKPSRSFSSSVINPQTEPH